MSGPPVIPPAGAARLHARRCVRHPAREAAARCPGCAEFFCRECVVEHDGKLLCAGCLARAAGGRERRQQRWRALRRGVATVAGVVVLWWMFYIVGAVLLKVPADVHDGTIWRKTAEDAVR